MLVAFSITKAEKKSCKGRQGHRTKEHCVVLICFASPHLLTQNIDSDATTYSGFETVVFLLRGRSDRLGVCILPWGQSMLERPDFGVGCMASCF